MVNVQICLEFSIKTQSFTGVLQNNDDITTLKWKWDIGEPVGLKDILKFLPLPDNLHIPDFLKFNVNSPIATYSKNKVTKSESYEVVLTSKKLGQAVFKAVKNEGENWQYSIIFNPKNIELNTLPIVGEVPTFIDNIQLCYLSCSDGSADVAADLKLAKEDGKILPGLTFICDVITGQEKNKLILGASSESQNNQSEQLISGSTNNNGGSTEISAVTVPAVTADQNSSVTWIDINRSFGPAKLARIGGQFSDGRLQLLLDASVSLGPVTLSLLDLSLSIPLDDFSPEFSLTGLSLAYSDGAVEMSGTLLKKDDEYSGAVLIKTVACTISGIGVYDSVAESFYVFATMHKDLGGPPSFRVNGLAAGFGYNRKLVLPPIEQVEHFPLVRAAKDESYLTMDNTGVVFDELNKSIPSSLGDYWFAVGIRFNSFELIQSSALLSVSLGNETEIGLLGLSEMRVPKNANPGSEVAYAELALRVSFKPKDGTIQAEGRLTDRSYIFSKDCKLTGGFAFFMWQKGEYAGDFVVTLGGYHPDFVKPAHYPDVPRLGANWQVSNELSLKSEMYFALTPSCVMAGGRLNANYKSGCIHAWFIAYADFLLNWEPFHYSLRAGISIGVKANLKLFTVRVSVSVALELWGPEFGGKIDVDLTVISFSIYIGEEKSKPKKLTSDKFKQSFLPAPTSSQKTNNIRARRRLTSSNSDVFKVESASPVLVSKVSKGVVRDVDIDGRRHAIANPHELAIQVQSSVPITSFSDNSIKPQSAIVIGSNKLGIRPMAKTSLNAAFISKLYKDGEELIGDRVNNIQVCPSICGVPDALWGQVESEGVVSDPKPDAKTLNATTGLEFYFLPKQPVGALPAMAIKEFDYEDIPKPIPWDNSLRPSISRAPSNLETTEEIMQPNVNTPRIAVLKVLKEKLAFDLNKVDLTLLSESKDFYFQAQPVYCQLGTRNEGVA